MKRIILVLLPLLLAAACAFADSSVSALLAEVPGADVLSIHECGSTAVSIVRIDDDQLALCLLEDTADGWRLRFCSPDALFQDEPAPSITLVREDTFSWATRGMTFTAAREWDGTWGAVSQSVTGGGLESYTFTTIEWDAVAQEFIKTVEHRRNTDDSLLYAPLVIRLPAPWLADCVMLADFDISSYPWLEYEEYDGDWPEHDLIVDAASYLMPDWKCRGGSYTSDECFRFLMERKDGRPVFVGVTRELEMDVSTPMPAGTYFGVENFTDWLGSGNDSFYLQLNPDRKTWGLAAVMSWREDSEDLILSPAHIYHNHTRIVIGEHPWSDVTKIDWRTLPRYIIDGYHQTDSTRWAIVRNPDPADRLHLRTSADRHSNSKGKYYTGTPVTVLGVQGDWVHVHIAGHSGWMMKEYLEFGEHLITTAEYMPEFSFRGEQGNLYSLADHGARKQTMGSAYSWRICGILWDEWYHVWNPQENEYGFVLQKDVYLQ